MLTFVIEGYARDNGHTLPDRAAELALETGAVAVSEPLSALLLLARSMLARYAAGAVELVPV